MADEDKKPIFIKYVLWFLKVELDDIRQSEAGLNNFDIRFYWLYWIVPFISIILTFVCIKNNNVL